jgi:hypothetical protein
VVLDKFILVPSFIICLTLDVALQVDSLTLPEEIMKFNLNLTEPPSALNEVRIPNGNDEAANPNLDSSIFFLFFIFFISNGNAGDVNNIAIVVDGSGSGL